MMPIINIRLNPKNHAFDESERKIIGLITKKKDGSLRASKPKDGIAAYVWRMVAFYVSPKPAHKCIPVMAFAYLPFRVTTTKGLEAQRKLDELVDKIVDCVPLHQQHGVLTWGRALGVL